MKTNNDNNLDKRTKKYRELLDQMIVEVKDASIEEHEEPFRGWLHKNHVIWEDIEKLKKDSNVRFKIYAFLLETQFLEFQLIDLLQKLEILINSDPDIVTFNGRKRSKELYEMPLGMLKDELFRYESNFLENLKPLIKELNERRIRFAHYLFTSIKGIKEVVEEAKDGLVHNEKVFKELLDVLVHIEKNTWYGQMHERKRVKEFSKKGNEK